MRTRVLLSFILAVIFVVGAQPGDAAGDSLASSEELCTIKRGRTVDVRFGQSLRPRDVKHGQLIWLEVAADVAVDGNVVIKECAPVAAHVREVKQRQAAGIPAQLEIVVDYARAIDGHNVPLSGMYSAEGADRHVEAAGIAIFWCICGLLIPGEDVLVAEGTVVTCFVRRDTVIRIGGSHRVGPG